MLYRLACILVAIPGLCRAGVLRAGAASVDITPAADASLLMGGYGARTLGHTGIHDNVFVRAIVLDDGATQVALVAWELIGVPDAVWADVSKQVTAEIGIRPENLILAAVHNHGAAILGATPANTAEYTKTVKAAAVESIRRAKARLQPARFGIGTGAAYINMNRRELTAAQGWWLGFNENGPSNKTVNVLRFEDMTGKPIAFLINYAVHVVVMGPENRRITGDLAGATSRFVEQHYRGKDHPRSDAGERLRLKPAEKSDDDGPVAVWTSGAAGDQNPVSMASGDDFTLVDAFGKVLGEEVVRVAGSIKTTAEVRLRGAQKVVTCPGRQVEAGPRPRADYKFTDADPVNIRLGLVMIDKIPLAGVSGEVFTLIHSRLQKESPFPHTLMITHANGGSGYIPNDAGYDQISYEVTSTHLKPGCAENAIVNGFLDMLRGFQ
jgi:Neutral/alkaline non-lysosomal ceramidase, N-terminal